jgi:CHASE2 domain-containing sensor protein/signal transduction histidine kinase
LSAHSQRKMRLLREWWLTTAVSLALLALLVFGDLARPVGNVLYDQLMRWQGFRTTQDVVIVAIDDRSVLALGGWPLQRVEYAKLLHVLNADCCRPKAMGLDLLFLDARPTDAALAAQLKQHAAVLPLAFDAQRDGTGALHAVLPVAPLADAATLGHVNLAFDADGVIRGFHPREQGWPHFALALQAKGTGNGLGAAVLSDEVLRFRMVDPRVGFPTVSLVDVLESAATRSVLKNKYVLLGVTAPSLGDRYPTLYSGKHSASTPGVAILASVLNAALHDDVIHEAAPWVSYALMLVPLWLMLKSLVWLRPRQALMFAVFGVVCVGGVSAALLAYANYWVDPVPFVWVAALLQPLWAWRRLEAMADWVQHKAADLRQMQPAERSREAVRLPGDFVMQHAHVLDHAVASAQSELGFLSAVIDEMPEAVLIFDAQERLLLRNRQVTQWFGTRFEVGSEMAHLVQLLPIAIAQGARPSFQLSTAEGVRDFVVKTALLPSPLGGNLQLFVLMDITELQQSQKQRDRALQFLSHDMRTPIASILSLTRPMADAQMAHGQREKVVHHAQALLGMMDDFILTISSEAATYEMQSESLDNLIQDSLAQVADLARAKGVGLQDNTQAAEVFVQVNRRLLVRALVNVLVNAIKFSPAQSAVCIASSCTQSPSGVQVSLTVSNTIAAAASADDLAPSMHGFGLGLDFVNQVVRKHQGTITQHIPPSGVATVVVMMPCEMA